MGVVLNWVGGLVDPDFEPVDQQQYTEPDHSAKKFKADSFSSSYSPSFSPPYAPTPEPPAMPPPPPPPASAPPPLPLPNPLAPSQPNTAFLPLFNQTANQRRMFVEYPAQFSGPAHAGKWTVKCVGEHTQDGPPLFTSCPLTFFFSQQHRERHRFGREQAARQGRGRQTGVLRNGLGPP